MNYKIKLIACTAVFLLATACVCLPVMAGQTDALPLNNPDETVSNDITSSDEVQSVISIVSEVVDSGNYSQTGSDAYSSETPSVDSGITSSDGFSSSSDIAGDSDNTSSEPMSSDVSSAPTSSDVYSSDSSYSTTTSYYDPDYTYSYDNSYDYEHYISIYSNVSVEAHSTINSENWSDVSLDETNSKEMEKLINAGQKGDFSFIKNRKDTGAGSAWYWLVGGIALIALGTAGLIYSIRSTMKARVGTSNTSGARNTRTSRARSTQKRASSRGDTAEIKLPKKNRK